MADTPGLQEPLPLSSTTFTMMGTVRTSLTVWCSPLMDSHTKKQNKNKKTKNTHLHGLSAAWGHWRYTGQYAGGGKGPVAEVVFQAGAGMIPTMVAISESASSASSSTSSNDFQLVDIGSRASTGSTSSSQTMLPVRALPPARYMNYYATEQHGAPPPPNTQPPTELWDPSSAQPPPNRQPPTPNPLLTQTTHAFHSGAQWV